VYNISTYPVENMATRKRGKRLKSKGKDLSFERRHGLRFGRSLWLGTVECLDFVGSLMRELQVRSISLNFRSVGRRFTGHSGGEL
jgi:hypothetical protein